MTNADEGMLRWFQRRARASASPGAAKALILVNSQIDVRHVLPSIRVPTIVLHRAGDADSRREEGRYLAEHIEGARFAELRALTTSRGATPIRSSTRWRNF